MKRVRIGIFGRATKPGDGGSDTLLRTIDEALHGLPLGAEVELVAVPWSAWSHRRRPLRYAWSRVVRGFGGEIPLVDLRPVCRRWRLDAAYFSAPAYAHIGIPFIYTVWDLGHRTIPEFPEMRIGRDPWTMREAQYRRMIAQASFVIAGNATGAAELERCYGVEPRRVYVLPFPNPDFATTEAGTPTWLRGEAGPFFFYPAQFWPHKNHHTLLRALALLGSRAPRLVFVGSEKGNRSYLESEAARLGVGDRVQFEGFVSRGDLKSLYQRAVGLVFPSMLGPNNLPPQEAAVLGCPMILSDLPGHREQLGDGALYAAPLAAEAWAAAIERVTGDAALRGRLVERARAAVAECTPANYAAGLAAVLNELVQLRQLWG